MLPTGKIVGCADNSNIAQRVNMNLTTFGQRVFWARRNHARLTQKQLRDKMFEMYEVEIGRNYISQMETDPEVTPSFGIVRAMAGALGVSLDYLAGFSQSYLPVQGEEATPVYFSEEADEVARLVDAMHPSQRQLVLNVAKNMLSAPTPRQRERADIRDMLDSIARDKGDDVRREVEEFLRHKGLSVDSTP